MPVPIFQMLYRGLWSSLYVLLLFVASLVHERLEALQIPFPPVRNYLLMTEETIEQRIGDFLELVEIVAAGDRVTMLSSGEFPFEAEIHDDDEGDDDAWAEDVIEPVPTVLTFYASSEIPDTLALVRFSAQDPESDIMLVSEDHYKETPAELARLESDVHDCLMEGIDVSVLSSHTLDTFPYLKQIIDNT